MKKINVLLLILVLVITGCANVASDSGEKEKDKADKKQVFLSSEELKENSLDFVNNYLLFDSESKATLGDDFEKVEINKFKIKLPDGREVSSFISSDGKYFFAEALDIEDYKKKVEEQKSLEAAKNKEIPKTAKPKVELFVMSHCPYVTQTEKGILPVKELLKDKIDFSIKFVDYAMHGKTEVDEQLNQYCIQKEQSDNFDTYLKCFLVDSDGAGCLDRAGIDKKNLTKCVEKTDKEFKISELFADKSSWVSGQFPQFNINKDENDLYGIKGSPSIVINGVQKESNRDPNSMLKAVCEGFSVQPEDCGKELSKDTPSAGFGFGSADVDSANASCH